MSSSLAANLEAAVIIPTYNHLDYALLSAKTALANTPNSIVMVVDDASPEWDSSIWSCLPQDRLIIHRFPQNDQNLTRSWNWGLQKAKELRIPIAVPANSDLKFPKNWSMKIFQLLRENRADLVGPATNAPGHRQKQQITTLIPDYNLDDSDDYIDQVQEKLMERKDEDFVQTLINGFCMAALTDTWWSGAFDSSCVFNPKNKMMRNEDELIGRWLGMGRKVGYCPYSFVWHYRSVSRAVKTGKQYQGWYRKSKG